MDREQTSSGPPGAYDNFPFGPGHDSSNLGMIDPVGRLKALSDYGNSVDIDNNIPPRRYFRSGLEMVRMANVYLDEGNLENAFILYMKFMTLFIEKIRTHPDFASVSVTDRAINSQKLREVMPKAERLKSRLLEQYQKEHQRYLSEKKRRDEKERERRKQEAEREQQQFESGQGPAPSVVFENGMKPVPVMVPTIATDSIVYPDDLDVMEKPDSLELPNTEPSGQVVRPPSRTYSGARPSVDLPSSDRPTIDRNTKPAALLSPSMHSKLGLRDVVVPSRLMSKFLNLAQRNTDQNIETCGILAGKLNHDQLLVSHLLIPKQQGTPDSCLTQNEEEIFDYQDRHDLITLGWIHTHPSQTAFLSSVDLHTHCSYQLMMPEALAIVCAPRYQENGFFILTPSYGLNFIARCRQTGFHPHPTDPPLFMKAEHVKMDSDASIDVVDLRSGR